MRSGEVGFPREGRRVGESRMRSVRSEYVMSHRAACVVVMMMFSHGS